MPHTPRPPKDLRTAWLLLLLRQEPSYGYVLRRELIRRGLDIEPGTLYRGLRQLERDELITSRWMDSAGGPRSRVYTITQEGRRCLDELAEDIGLSRDCQVAFLTAYERATEERLPGESAAAQPDSGEPDSGERASEEEGP